MTLVYGFSRPTADLDVLEIAPERPASPSRNSACRAALSTRNTGSILIPLAWHTYPRAMKRNMRCCAHIVNTIPAVSLAILSCQY